MYIHKGSSDTMKYATVQMANGQNKINYKLNYQRKIVIIILELHSLKILLYLKNWSKMIKKIEVN